jgi:hypothetical protein
MHMPSPAEDVLHANLPKLAKHYMQGAKETNNAVSA